MLLNIFKIFLYVCYDFIVKVEQDTRNDVVFDVKTSVFRSMAVEGCNSKYIVYLTCEIVKHTLNKSPHNCFSFDMTIVYLR